MKNEQEILDIIKEELGTLDVDIVIGKGMVSFQSKDFTLDYPHYRKDVRSVSILDIYKVCQLFNVDDSSGAIHHVIKKLLASGNRGIKNKQKDRLESLVTLVNFLEMENVIDVDGSIQTGTFTIKVKDSQIDNLKIDKVKGK